MADIKISVDTSEVTEALAGCEDVLKEYLEQALDRAIKRLVEDVAKPIAQQEFGFDGAVTVYAEKTNDGYAVIAEGEEVCFLEFGAGVYTDNGHPFASEAPFIIKAGSWSETHAQTWQKWIEAGKDPEKYPYNQPPLRAMYSAYKAILQNYEWIIKDELGI